MMSGWTWTLAIQPPPTAGVLADLLASSTGQPPAAAALLPAPAANAASTPWCRTASLDASRAESVASDVAVSANAPAASEAATTELHTLVVRRVWPSLAAGPGGGCETMLSASGIMPDKFATVSRAAAFSAACCSSLLLSLVALGGSSDIFRRGIVMGCSAFAATVARDVPGATAAQGASSTGEPCAASERPCRDRRGTERLLMTEVSSSAAAANKGTGSPDGGVGPVTETCDGGVGAADDRVPMEAWPTACRATAADRSAAGALPWVLEASV
mmetsp:Transcript_95023/g.165026  ORF Transcript_95023/g.165026 Transcript_95023/m.165026 type:complete len:273 (+) Transcript_95023:3-821(+)